MSGNVVVNQEPHGIKWELRKILTRIFLINNYQGKLTPSTFGYPIHEWEINRPTEVELFPGYSMNYRRELILRHPCDERLSGYSFREDVDLSYRISREAKLIMVPDARFIHNPSQINRLDIKNLKKMHFKNYYYLFKKFKNPGIFSKVLFYYSLSGMILIDFLEFIFRLDRKKYQLFFSDFTAMRGMKEK